MRRYHIRPARSSDLAAIVGLLQTVHLPTEDLAQATGLQLWVSDAQSDLAGAIALQGTGERDRLLRSLVVAPPYRRRGLAQALISQVERYARAERIEQLVLLTQTAQTLFSHLGYQVIERHQVSERLRDSAEFRSLCPESAICMMKRVMAVP